MTTTIVVGGQFGSEGKGKVVARMALRASAPWVVRCGGPNSGHTTIVNGRDVVLRQVPAGVASPEATLALAAGCAIDESLLLSEISLLGIERERIVVDPRAVLVEPEDLAVEAAAIAGIGSTGSGTGSALVRRMMRGPGVRLAGQSEMLRDMVRVECVSLQLQRARQLRREIIIEGTQGFGLSLLHGVKYPFVTARDTTASGFASEVGLAPSSVDRVCVVVRTFPIRVGGNSGPLPSEIDWDTVRTLSQAPVTVPELTSVTRRVRRVARFDLAAVVSACVYNGATELAVMGLDRLDYSNTGASCIRELSLSGRRFLKELGDATGVPVRWIGTGFETMSAFALDELSGESTLDSYAVG